MQTDRQAEAEKTYTSLIEEYPDSDEAAEGLAALGQMMQNRGNNQISYDYYSRLADKGGSNRLEAFVGMGNARLALNDPARAREQYEAALKISGSFPGAKVGMAKVAMEEGNYGEAAEQLNPIAEANTSAVGAEAQYLLGVAKQQQGEYKAAIDEYANVSVLYQVYDRWVAKSMLKSAECYTELGNSSEARKMLQDLRKRYPRSTEAQQAGQMLQN
jgi:TolA-binding protein